MIARLKKISQILVAKWDDELVVFNSKSGDTHLFPVIFEPIIHYCSERDDFLFAELLSYIEKNASLTLKESESIVEDGVRQLVNIGFLQPVTSD